MKRRTDRISRTRLFGVSALLLGLIFGGMQTAHAAPPSALAAASPVIGTDHPTQPGEVKLFKEAKPAEGSVNEWDVTLRMEAKESGVTSDVVLLIDTSASMTTVPSRIEGAKQAAKSFVDELVGPKSSVRNRTRIALVTFNNYPEEVSQFSNDADALSRDIDALETKGATFTQGGIRKAHELLKQSSADAKHLVLLSDGRPNLSFSMHNPDPYLSPQQVDDLGIFPATTADAPREAYTEQRFGQATSSFSPFSLNPPRYYNHANSAIAEAGYVKGDGGMVWAIGLDLDDAGNETMRSVASPNGAFTADPGQLSSVFQRIAGEIISPVRSPMVVDPMGPGFEIPESAIPTITTVPAGPGQVDYTDGTVTWTPGTLTETVPEAAADPSLVDVKYAQITYRVAINDRILSAQADGEGRYPANGDALVRYQDPSGAERELRFPVPMVDPLLIFVESRVYDANGDLVALDHTTTVEIIGPENHRSEYTVNPALAGDPELRQFVKGLRWDGEYAVGSVNGLGGYDQTYSIIGAPGGGVESTDRPRFTANVGDPDRTIVIHHRPRAGALAITKQLDLSRLSAEVRELLSPFTFQGVYECTRAGAVTASGTWSVAGAEVLRGDGVAPATLSHGANSPGPREIPTGSTCVVREDTAALASALPQDRWSWREPEVSYPGFATDGAMMQPGVTAEVTVTNALTDHAAVPVPGGWDVVPQPGPGGAVAVTPQPGPKGTLASTGVTNALPWWIGSMLLLVGAALTVVSRRPVRSGIALSDPDHTR